MSEGSYEQVTCEHPDHPKVGDAPKYFWLPTTEVQRLKVARLLLLCELHRSVKPARLPYRARLM